ncbi:putative zinc-binding protein [Aliidiomarina celeris]|uniref:putative zinc-binding protein n=1 Tax=Aliidiomarina celeris TaxID=2249428 RepID=UPI000DE8B308|nr:putative zinc-binding protein [Aliidiomarina celeris]
MTHQVTEKPLVYSCSGCSNVAQLANDLAVWMRNEQKAEMSCIAGVGGNVKQLVRVATSGRKIIAIDGCPLNCVRQSLAQHNVEPTWHIQLTDCGLKKRDEEACTLADSYQAIKHIQRIVGEEIDFSPMLNSTG